jgi:hypothetical protein
VSGPAIDAVATQRADARAPRPGLRVLVREWGRIGCIGLGGPPAHIALLRELCVTRRGWLSDHEFEDAIAAANLLPGPASTPAGDLCAWRLRGIAGALVGGVSFILPGLILVLGRRDFRGDAERRRGPPPSGPTRHDASNQLDVLSGG